MQKPQRVAEKARVLQKEQDKLRNWRETPLPCPTLPPHPHPPQRPVTDSICGRAAEEQPGWSQAPLDLLPLCSTIPGVTKWTWLRAKWGTGSQPFNGAGTSSEGE